VWQHNSTEVAVAAIIPAFMAVCRRRMPKKDKLLNSGEHILKIKPARFYGTGCVVLSVFFLGAAQVIGEGR